MATDVSATATDLLRGLQQMAVDMVRDLGDRFVEKAQSGTSRRTQKLHDSIKADPPIAYTDHVEVRVSVGADYGRYQDEGTGIYGPDGHRITPKRGNVLRFDWPAAGGITFATSVAGSPGTHFWTKAIDDWPFIVRRASRGG